MTRILAIGYLLFTSLCTSYAQYDREELFPNLQGDALRDALIADFRPVSTLSYGEARDLLFGDIDTVNDTLTCVYTGYKIYISPDLDPTTTAFDQGINTEHTFPKSKGADDFTLGYSDMHHLFATRVGANSARGSLPLNEINDVNTDEWFYLNNTFSSIPTSNIEKYSEYQENVAFEPREDHKGNVARAYFYFYTMYKSQADIADPTFFSSQVEDMCDWHNADPVDKAEWVRSKNIAAEQGNENPFILDCAVARLYCDNVATSCLTVSTEEATFTTPTLLQDAGLVKISGIKSTSDLYVINTMGQILHQSMAISEDIIVDTSPLPTGLYFVHLVSEKGVTSTFRIVK